MIQKVQNIGRLKLTGDANKDIQTLLDVVAKFEEYICGKVQPQITIPDGVYTIGDRITATTGNLGKITISDGTITSIQQAS